MNKSPGQIAHDAYHYMHGDGPFNWEHVSAKDKQAWEATALAVVNYAFGWYINPTNNNDDPPPFWKPDYHGLPTE